MRCDLRSVCLRRVTKSASFFAVQLWRSRPVTRFTTFAAPERYMFGRGRGTAATRGAGGAGSGLLCVRL